MRIILAILALALIACQVPTQPTPNGDIVVQQIVGQNPSSPTQDPVCLPIDRIRIVNFPTLLNVGTSAGIDVTPKDQFGNNRSDNCNDATGNHWTSNEDVCSVLCPTCFNTTIRGLKAGTCELTANVGGKTDSVKFPVN